ncbi:hypothetical protein HPB50_009312 [Hyalomma asiaticum]|uniref:Uncharacterized protein n=1 Tax=Hyalomma asiaticum TaxID=266040 RepID=A0ACB7TEY1_HYAAI|nr:hypothetical protein HPB50_009312 [Hyalomma asiaticum]
MTSLFVFCRLCLQGHHLGPCNSDGSREAGEEPTFVFCRLCLQGHHLGPCNSDGSREAGEEPTVSIG